MRSDQKEARDRYTEIIKHRSRDSQLLGWKPGDRSNTALMNKFQKKNVIPIPKGPLRVCVSMEHLGW
jgi:hypothetical protein